MSTAASKSAGSKPGNPNRELQRNSSDQAAAGPQDMEQECSEMKEDFQAFIDEVGTSVSAYCRKRPGVAAGMLFLVGFYMGWKIKPW